MPVVRIQGGSALVDEADLPLIAGYKWRVQRQGRLFYAVACTGRTTSVLMHRLILGAEKGQSVDHANSAGLDNRRKNIRICTNAQNMMNVRKTRGEHSRFKGVGKSKDSRKWVARIMRDGREMHLGTFDDERSAARKYDHTAVKLFGEFARTNAMMGLFDLSA